MLLERELINNLEEICGNANRTLLLEAANKRMFEIVKLLLEQGANVNAQSNGKYTALFHATFNNDLEMAELLINKGADISVRYHDMETPLIVTAKLNSPKIMQLLIDSGADINAQDNYGNTALLMATCYNKIHNAKILIDAGAKLDIKCDSGNDALYYATCNNYREIAAIITDAMKNKSKQINQVNQVCKNTDGTVYPILVPKHLICHAIYRIDPNATAPNTQLVSIIDDETMAKIWSNGVWADKKLCMKNYSIQIPVDKTNKIDYHAVIIDDVEIYVKFDDKLELASGTMGDVYRN